jgi:hypothetical protein
MITAVARDDVVDRLRMSVGLRLPPVASSPVSIEAF